MELSGNIPPIHQKNGFEEDMKVSIIIPVFNAGKYLQKCLESILIQDSTEIEIICVDDGSTDDSLDILHRYEKHFCNMKIIKQCHEGLSVARNNGLLLATGEYIFYVDADDLVEKNFILYAYNICAKKDLDVLLFSFENFCNEDCMRIKYGDRLKTPKRTYEFNNVLDGKQAIVQLIRNNEYYNMVWIQFVKRSFVLKENLYFKKGIVFEDVVYTYRMLLLSEKVLCIKTVGYKKRIHSESICGSKESVEKVSSLWDNCKKIEKINLLLDEKDVSYMYIKNEIENRVKAQFVLHYDRLNDSQKEIFNNTLKV